MATVLQPLYKSTYHTLLEEFATTQTLTDYINNETGPDHDAFVSDLDDAIAQKTKIGNSAKVLYEKCITELDDAKKRQPLESKCFKIMSAANSAQAAFIKQAEGQLQQYRENRKIHQQAFINQLVEVAEEKGMPFSETQKDSLKREINLKDIKGELEPLGLKLTDFLGVAGADQKWMFVHEPDADISKIDADTLLYIKGFIALKQSAHSRQEPKSDDEIKAILTDKGLKQVFKDAREQTQKLIKQNQAANKQWTKTLVEIQQTLDEATHDFEALAQTQIEESKDRTIPGTAPTTAAPTKTKTTPGAARGG